MTTMRPYGTRLQYNELNPSSELLGYYHASLRDGRGRLPWANRSRLAGGGGWRLAT